MNYYGGVLNSKISSRIYSFLREAMKEVEEERPFRGPKNFVKGKFRYEDKSNGDLRNFEGKEIIWIKDKKAYELRYHGGEIRK